MANNNRIPRPTTIASHGQQQSHPTANNSLLPWPTTIASHGQQQSHSMANNNRIPWPTTIAFHGRHQSHSMANTNRITWPTTIAFHGQQLSHSMTTTYRIPWPTPIASHGQHYPHCTHPDCTDCQRTRSLFTRRDPQDRLLQSAHKRDTSIGVRKFHRSVKVLKKTSIHGTRRYADTLQCSNTGHGLFVATRDGLLFAACSACLSCRFGRAVR